MSRRSDRFKKILPTDVPRRGLDVTVSTGGATTGRFDAPKPNMANAPKPAPNFEVGAVQGDSPGGTPGFQERGARAWAAAKAEQKRRPKKYKPQRKVLFTEVRVRPDFVITFEGQMQCPTGLAEEFYSKLLRAGLKAALRENEKVRVRGINGKRHCISHKYIKEKG